MRLTGPLPLGESTAAEPLPTVDLALLGTAAGCLVLGALGAWAASSLLVYSPTKLAKRLGVDADDERVQTIDRQEMDLQVLARMVALGSVLAAAVTTWEAVPGQRWLALAALVVATLFLCGVLPTAFAHRRAESGVLFATRVLGPLRSLLYWPLLRPTTAIASGVLRVFRIPDAPSTDPDEIADEILAAVADSAHDNELAPEERSWIENIVELKDRHAHEAMTPRTDIVAFDREMPILEAVRAATEAGYSRYPVYEEKLDRVVGVFYAKDALELLGNADADGRRSVGDIMRKPLFVPEMIGLVDLLREFRTSKVQLAVLLDEYGGTAGIASIEDILEEIVGDISDEYDVDEEVPIKVVEEGRIVEISGRARVDEVNEVLGSSIPESEEYETVAGFVFNTLDRIPKVDETVAVDSWSIRVLRADDRRIIRLRVATREPAPTPHGQP